MSEENPDDISAETELVDPDLLKAISLKEQGFFDEANGLVEELKKNKSNLTHADTRSLASLSKDLNDEIRKRDLKDRIYSDVEKCNSADAYNLAMMIMKKQSQLSPDMIEIDEALKLFDIAGNKGMGQAKMFAKRIRQQLKLSPV